MIFTTISNEALSLILLAICILPIAVLIVFAFVKMVLRLKNVSKNYENNHQNQDELKDELVNAFGGEENIVNVQNEMNRVIVEVRDIELVKGEELQKLGATGVLLVGSTVKCGFGDRAQEVYELLK